MEGLFGRIPEEAPDESPASTPPPSPARDAQAAPPAEQALCRVASVVLAKDGVELGRVEDVVPHALIEAGADLKPPCLGKTALQWAVARVHGEVAALLWRAGAQ